MKKSRGFEDILDECLERLLVGGETIEQCLQSFPEHADELRLLLETALAARGAAAVQPRPEFRDRARYQFHSALQGMESKKSRPVFGWQLGWVTAVSVVLVLLLAGGGTVAAAGGSMPDDTLYQVKLATEQVQLLLTPSALGKAELYAELADKRVVEIVRMADESKPEQIELAAQRLDTCLTAIVDLTSAQGIREGGGGIAEPMLEEAMVAEEAWEDEEEVLVTEAPTVAEEEEEAEEAEEAVVAETAPVTVEAPSLQGKAVPSESAGRGNGKEVQTQVEGKAELKVTVQNQAASNSARLRAVLETAPESAKPALLRAIAISEAGYKKALESLEQP